MSEEKRDSKLQLVVTVLSAESLKLPSCPLLPRRRPRPYVILSTAAAAAGDLRERTPPHHVTRVDATNPTWNDTVRISVDPTFLLPRRRCRRSGGWEEEEDDSVAIHVSVMSTWRFLGPTELGWCQILPCYVVDGLRPPDFPRRLSYALRAGRHGGPGQGVIHLSVRLVGPGVERIAPTTTTAAAAAPAAPAAKAPPRSEEDGRCQVALGIPVGTVGYGGRGGAWGGRGDFGGHVAAMNWF